jgi:accessory colonization factor AcfC
VTKKLKINFVDGRCIEITNDVGIEVFERMFSRTGHLENFQAFRNGSLALINLDNVTCIERYE